MTTYALKHRSLAKLLVAVGAVCLSTATFADRRQAQIDYADVLDVQPIVKTFEDRTPIESCWTERVRNERHHSARHGSATSTITGGIIGGAIGNAVGHSKRNKQVGAAVGALLGAAIGHDIGHKHRPARTEVYYTNERYCETHYEVSYRDETVGYWVTYEYQGRQHRTQMNRDPGERMRVRVTVEPF